MRPDNMPRPHTPEFGAAEPKPSAEALLRKLENYPFSCQGGDLRNCQDWIELKRLVISASAPANAAVAATDKAQAVLDMLLDRGGFDDWWGSIDEELQSEILEALGAIISEQANAPAPSSQEHATGDPDRYFMDHGMIHDRQTGQHISTDESTHPGGTRELFGRLRSYERMVHRAVPATNAIEWPK